VQKSHSPAIGTTAQGTPLPSTERRRSQNGKQGRIVPKYVLFVHGYSETTLGAYYQFPAILKASEPSIQTIALAGFDSLDDSITIDDLANAMEVRVASLIANYEWDVADSAVICHSTGALIARRWILNRVAAGAPIPSHLITMAGANHGSTLAHMGKSVLGYLQKLVLHREWSVGQGVLTDLEYGSDFLLNLNREWLEAWNDERLAHLYAFSAGGDTPGPDPVMDIFWQTHEPGSDNTVRISGANLNYTWIDVLHDENGTNVTALTPNRRTPHLILPGYSHFGTQSGILGNVHAGTDPPMQAVRDALKVSTPEQYAVLEAAWRAQAEAWSASHVPDANATTIFTLLDRSGVSIGDCMIAFLTKAALGAPSNAEEFDGAAAQARAAAMQAASGALLSHSPIQNDVETGSYEFYLNFDCYAKSSPHWFHVTFGAPATMGRDTYPYAEMLFSQPANLAYAIAPNETTYVHLAVGRTSDEAYAIWRWDPNLNLDTTQVPPNETNVEYRIAPPP
jgi:hypothetical protein